MSRALLGFVMLVVLASAPAAAQRCPSLDVVVLGKGLAAEGPWRAMSGGPAECSFRGKTTSVNFGFNHMPAPSVAAAESAATDMREAVAPTSVVEPMPVLGERGFAYQPRAANGQVDRTSMFFYGHRGTVGISAYLNLAKPITPAQRDFAASLIASSLSNVADRPKALAKATNCKYLDPDLLARLLPGDVSTVVPDARSCVANAGDNVVTVSVANDARGWPIAERMLKGERCTVDALPNLGKGAGIAHHCGSGNPRAEVVVTTGSRWVRVLHAPAAEPTAQDRDALVELARFATAK